MWHCDHSPCPISCVIVSRLGPSVLHALGEGRGVLEDGVAGPAVDVDDEAHPAGVPFQAGVVQALSFWQTPAVLVKRHLVPHLDGTWALNWNNYP